MKMVLLVIYFCCFFLNLFGLILSALQGNIGGAVRSGLFVLLAFYCIKEHYTHYKETK